MAVIDSELCLGCGVCTTACKFDPITLEAIDQRVNAPEGPMERLLQAIERGKLQNFIFSDATKLSHRSLAAIFKLLLALPPAKQLPAQRQLKSGFVETLLSKKPRNRPQST